ncbi:galactosyltransferase-related protein [Roseomonas sp. NAR14]|uniref:Galactosyltransferase-related protein n=1 Tax=Roseomonas acroporae TaxID=2937791 RepID=A0A9X1Y7Z0_9PROT|nr:galactosyltransferase-related protein [Roseomonas acroporae]MCK8784780.1 galactosyltransferase-related protein [Roseomonas acroporae]
MTEPGVAVLTLVKGRDAHLRRVMAALERGTRRPDRLVVVDMGESPAAIGPTTLPLTLHRLPAAGLPLAAARNAAARLAGMGPGTETGAETGAGAATLIFLDVDCIPAANLVAALAADVAAADALVCPEILYLPAGAADAPEARLRALGRRHHVRPFPAAGMRAEPNAGLFWSLAFAVRHATFGRIGGFDAGYTGYGAEDTDFAFRARAAGVPLLFTASTVAFHQHHGVYDPPLQHFADIVANASRFRERHGFWPMDGWLDAFARLGLIDPPGDGPLRVLRPPTAAEVAAARQGPERVY